MSGDLEAASRFLSYVLRHDPGSVGVVLDDSGWTDIGELLAAAARHGHPIGPEMLGEILAGQYEGAQGKRRFETRDGKIRAAQGHSVPVDLGLTPLRPPELLYHGTVARFLGRIRSQGLQPRGRTHVHLSADRGSARAAGARRGEPVILVVRALAMYEAGGTFYRAANNVWLTAHVPPQWLSEKQQPCSPRT